MQLSIAKLVATLILLLISVTVITTGAGLLAVQSNYRSLESRHGAEANDAVNNAALAIRNQIRFYQGILQLIVANAEISDLLEFSDTPQIADWSRAVGRLLPGTLGTALSNAHGVVYGDPLALRVGAACQLDMRRFAEGGTIDYPLLHTDVSGFEHFDLLARISTPSGEQAGTLFVSFRLSVLRDLLESIAQNGDRFVLLGRDGGEKLVTGKARTSAASQRFQADVPDTSWRLVLQRPVPVTDSPIDELLLIDAVILFAFGLLIAALVHTTLQRFKSDLLRIHRALEDVLSGRYQPSDAPTAIKETGILLPDIEQLALKIQHQRDELRHQSLSDPLTNVFNRRYFDLMLAHHHEQSRRQQPAILVIVDLNDFKHINDEFGHSTGDHVLQQAAHFLRSRVRATDIVARLGGDEFALILNHMAGDMLESWLTTLIDDYDRPSSQSAMHTGVKCQFSIGVAHIDAQCYPAPGDVFCAADRAMYRIKNRRNIRHSRFSIARPDADPSVMRQQEAR